MLRTTIGGSFFLSDISIVLNISKLQYHFTRFSRQSYLPINKQRKIGILFAVKHIKYPGHFFVVSAPSGAGKTSLVSTLIQQDPSIQVSVSHTTRTKRPGETDGQHYFFVSNKTFDAMIEADAFIEHANVFGNHYGTSRNTVLDLVNSGMDVVLEIDWQGAEQIRASWQESASLTSIFILPPNLESLVDRLKKRGQDDESTIEKRIANATIEIAHFNEFDYSIVNDNFEQATNELSEIISSVRRGEKPIPRDVRPLAAQLLSGHLD